LGHVRTVYMKGEVTRDLRVQVLSVVTMGFVINSRRLEGPYGIRLQGPQLLPTWNWGVVPSVYFPTFPSRNSHSVHINPQAPTSILGVLI